MVDDPKDRTPQQQQRFSSSESGLYGNGLGSMSPQRPDEARGETDVRGNDQTSEAARAMDHQKSALARQLHGLADAIQKVGSELRQSEQPALGRYTQQVGNSIRQLARDCEDRELGEIASMAEDFGRKQPLAFLGMAAIAGLAASRFLSASAQRSRNTAVNARPNSSPTRVKEGDWGFEKELRDA